MTGLLHMYNPMLLMAEEDIFPDAFCSGTSFPITCIIGSNNNTDLIQHLEQSQSKLGHQAGWQLFCHFEVLFMNEIEEIIQGPPSSQSLCFVMSVG